MSILKKFNSDDDTLVGRNYSKEETLTDEDRRILGLDCENNQHINCVENAHLSTVKCIVTHGPFAGPFVVDVIRYTGSFRTKYFWNGHQMLRRELYICGEYLPIKKVTAMWDASKKGIQHDNSTVPMLVSDLLCNKSWNWDDAIGEPTVAYFNK